ncbi:hypothetical protein MYX76_09600 [Desulfobacterota bacterium AH_259_B03_O07]|nr:hypothetical protein [Desulfobacterota bacterium AH_259_B03_O07]
MTRVYFKALVSMLFVFMFVLSCGGGSGDSRGSPPSGGQPPPTGGSKDFFVATYLQGNNTIDYEPISVTTQIGFSEVVINSFDFSGQIFKMSFIRPDDVPVEIIPGLSSVDPIGGALFTIGSDSFVYESGSFLITTMTNDRVAGELDFFARSQIDDSVVQVIGAFDLPNGILTLLREEGDNTL